jgi:hypothetical protein
MPISPHDIEQSWSKQQATVVSNLQHIDPSAMCHAIPIHDSVTLLTGSTYPINHCMGRIDSADIPQIEAHFHTHHLTPAFEFAPTYSASDLTQVLSQRGYTHTLTHYVMQCNLRRLPPISAASNLRWVAAERVAVASDASPDERLRAASYRRPGALCVSIMHSQGVIASAGIVVEPEFAHCFGAWVEPSFRRSGHYHTLLQSRLAYAQDLECAVVVMQVKPHGAAYHTALQWGFTVWYERHRWSATASTRSPS